MKKNLFLMFILFSCGNKKNVDEQTKKIFVDNVNSKTLYFIADKKVYQYKNEVFKELSSDISIEPNQLIFYNNNLFFSGKLNAYGTELLKLDIETKQVSLACDIWVGVGSSSPTNLTLIGDTIYFSARGNSSGIELFRYNLTNNNCQITTDFTNGSSNSSFPVVNAIHKFNDKIIVSIGDNNADGREPHFYDPINNQFSLLEDINPYDLSSNPVNYITIGEELFFIASNGVNKNLYRYKNNLLDIIDSFSLSSNISTMMKNNKLYYSYSFGGKDLLKEFDPVSELKQETIIDESGASLPSNFIVFNNKIYFTKNSSLGNELYYYDEEQDEVVNVTDLNINGDSYISSMTIVGNLMFFVASKTGASPLNYKLYYLSKNSNTPIEVDVVESTNISTMSSLISD